MTFVGRVQNCESTKPLKAIFRNRIRRPTTTLTKFPLLQTLPMSPASIPNHSYSPHLDDRVFSIVFGKSHLISTHSASHWTIHPPGTSSLVGILDAFPKQSHLISGGMSSTKFPAHGLRKLPAHFDITRPPALPVISFWYYSDSVETAARMRGIPTMVSQTTFPSMQTFC